MGCFLVGWKEFNCLLWLVLLMPPPHLKLFADCNSYPNWGQVWWFRSAPTRYSIYCHNSGEKIKIVYEVQKFTCFFYFLFLWTVIHADHVTKCSWNSLLEYHFFHAQGSLSVIHWAVYFTCDPTFMLITFHDKLHVEKNQIFNEGHTPRVPDVEPLEKIRENFEESLNCHFKDKCPC